MNTRALVRGISGKSLLAFAGIILLLSVVAGEAAAVTVSGKVTNLTGGALVTNVFVVATTLNFTFLAQAQPNAIGDYTISLPPMAPGTQFLVFVDPKNTRLVSALDDTIQKTLTFTGADLGPVDFKLVDGVKLSGKVTVQSTNGGADGVIVFATNPDWGWKFLGQVTTQAPSGTYDNLLVPPDERVELAVDKQGKFPGTVVDPPFLTVGVAKIELSNLDFFLIPGVVVQGHVTDGVQSILNALVEAFFVSSDPNVGWVWLGDDTTGPNGFYSVAVDASLGKILLRVTASGFVEKRVDVTWGSQTTTVTVDVVLSTSVQISGRVTDASYGNPIGGVPVEAYFGDLWLDGLNTDPNGFYTLDVPPNQGLVYIHVDTTSFPYLQPGDGEVVVGNVDFTGIDFALIPAVEISGTVINAETRNPIQGAGVTAFQGSLALAFDLTDANGFYTLKVAKAAAGQSYIVDIHVDAGPSFQTADQLVTVAESPITQNFALNPVVQTDTVTIQTATWSNNQLKITATNQVAGAKLFASVVDAAVNGKLLLDSRGNAILNEVQMTFKKGQYQIGKKTTVNLCSAFAKVRSDKGTTPATKQFCQP